MRWDLHVRFGERAGETDQRGRWHRVPVRLHHKHHRPAGAVSRSSILAIKVVSGRAQSPQQVALEATAAMPVRPRAPLCRQL
jgi:hypothetical protein